jgi:hypothetical protein
MVACLGDGFLACFFGFSFFFHQPLAPSSCLDCGCCNFNLEKLNVSFVDVYDSVLS